MRVKIDFVVFEPRLYPVCLYIYCAYILRCRYVWNAIVVDVSIHITSCFISSNVGNYDYLRCQSFCIFCLTSRVPCELWTYFLWVWEHGPVCQLCKTASGLQIMDFQRNNYIIMIFMHVCIFT